MSDTKQRLDIVSPTGKYGNFSAAEILEMHRLKLDRLPMFVYFALIVETKDHPWIHTVRFCQSYDLWRSAYLESLEVLKDRGFIYYAESSDRKFIRIIFLSPGETYAHD